MSTTVFDNCDEADSEQSRCVQRMIETNAQMQKSSDDVHCYCTDNLSEIDWSRVRAGLEKMAFVMQNDAIRKATLALDCY